MIIPNDNTAAIVGTIIGGMSALIIALLKFFGNKTLKKKVTSLKEELQKEKEERNECDHKIKEMKQAFRMGYEQLESDFKNKPQKMRLWKGIRNIFDD